MVNLDNSDAIGLPKVSGDMGDMGCDLLPLPLPFHALWAGMAAHPHMSSFSSKVPQSLMGADILQIASWSHVTPPPTSSFCLSGKVWAVPSGGVHSILP